MNEEGKDLKELKMPKGLIQKFADIENKLPNDDRKAQMIKGLEASRDIPKKIKEMEKTEDIKPKEETPEIEDSTKLAQEIKGELEGFER